jgi:uncharacterized protein (TIGR03083 family)
MGQPVGMAEDTMSKPHGTKDFWLAALRAEADAFRTAATVAALDAQVPSCPEWTVEDLVGHLGGVYAWVNRHVTRGDVSRPEPRGDEAGPAGAARLAWFDDRYAELLRTLESVEPELPAWNWAPQAKKAVFWHRRMAHETAVHRWDMQMASGATEPIEAKLASDGITEVLDSWLPAGRRHGETEGVRGIVALHATDVGQTWFIRLRGAGIALLDTDTLLDDDHPHERAQATGTASDLLLALYGRVLFDVLEVAGDPRLLQALRTG